MRFYKISAALAAFLICLLAGCQSPQESPEASATPEATATASPTEKPESSAVFYFFRKHIDATLKNTYTDIKAS